MKYVLIIQGGMYEDKWERCVGIYDTEEDAKRAEKEMQEILDAHIPDPNGFQSDLDADYCFIECVEENPNLSSIDIER